MSQHLVGISSLLLMTIPTGIRSGTSMASPHVAECCNLGQRISRRTIRINSRTSSETVKALIMSTAKPILTKNRCLYVSTPTRSRVVDSRSGCFNRLVCDWCLHPSVTLGNVGDSFTFDMLSTIFRTIITLKMLVNTDTDEVIEFTPST